MERSCTKRFLPGPASGLLHFRKTTESGFWWAVMEMSGSTPRRCRLYRAPSRLIEGSRWPLAPTNRRRLKLRRFACFNLSFWLIPGHISGRLLRRLPFRRQQIILKRFRHQLFELFHAGQFVHVFQSEAEKELLGGLI